MKVFRKNIILFMSIAGGAGLAWYWQHAISLESTPLPMDPTQSVRLLTWKELQGIGVGKLPEGMDAGRLHSTLVRIIGFRIEPAKGRESDVIAITSQGSCSPYQNATNEKASATDRAIVDLPPGEPVPEVCLPLYVEGYLRFPMELMSSAQTLISANVVRIATKEEISESAHVSSLFSAPQKPPVAL